MDLADLIRSRRTHKAYAPEPVDRATLDELFELARWAPNHNLTNPWRFRVLGPGGARAAQGGRGPGGGRQARAARRRSSPPRSCRPATRIADGRTATPPRAPATSSCSPRTSAASAATGARPGVLRTPAGRAACGIPDGEAVLGLLHLGEARGEKPAPERAPLEAVVEHLA